MNAEIYAEALSMATREADLLKRKKMIRNFAEGLKRRGHQKLTPKIFKSLEKIAARNLKMGKGFIHSVERLSNSERNDILKMIDKYVSGKDSFENIIDETLTGGWVVEKNNIMNY